MGVIGSKSKARASLAKKLVSVWGQTNLLRLSVWKWLGSALPGHSVRLMTQSSSISSPNVSSLTTMGQLQRSRLMMSFAPIQVLWKNSKVAELSIDKAKAAAAVEKNSKVEDKEEMWSL
eukprot:8533237-Karenia_brevis.AAC.1